LASFPSELTLRAHVGATPALVPALRCAAPRAAPLGEGFAVGERKGLDHGVQTARQAHVPGERREAIVGPGGGTEIRKADGVRSLAEAALAVGSNADDLGLVGLPGRELAHVVG